MVQFLEFKKNKWNKTQHHSVNNSDNIVLDNMVYHSDSSTMVYCMVDTDGRDLWNCSIVRQKLTFLETSKEGRREREGGRR